MRQTNDEARSRGITFASRSQPRAFFPCRNRVREVQLEAYKGVQGHTRKPRSPQGSFCFNVYRKILSGSVKKLIHNAPRRPPREDHRARQRTRTTFSPPHEGQSSVRLRPRLQRGAYAPNGCGGPVIFIASTDQNRQARHPNRQPACRQRVMDRERSVRRILRLGRHPAPLLPPVAPSVKSAV